jgi:hypothetical protein
LQRPEPLAEDDFCEGLRRLLEASADGFRSVTRDFKESANGVLVGRGTVQLPGALLCTAVQHLVSGAWKASYTCHFAGDDETVPKAEADRRFEALKQETRRCVPKNLKERDNTGGEDLGVVSTSFLGDSQGPSVTVFLNYNGGSAEHPSSIDLWLSVARSMAAGPGMDGSSKAPQSRCARTRGGAAAGCRARGAPEIGAGDPLQDRPGSRLTPPQTI